MNSLVPDWFMEDNSRSFGEHPAVQKQKKYSGQGSELVELLWRNGHVVMQSQSHHRKSANTVDFKQASKPEPALKSGGATGGSLAGMNQEDETVSWFHYPLDDSLEKDLFSEFFGELPASQALEQEEDAKLAAIAEGSVLTTPPPKLKGVESNLGSSGNQLEKEMGSAIQMEAGESSMMTIGSSICGSNHVQVQAEQCRAMSHAGAELPSGKANTNRNEAAGASSSGRSGCSFGRNGQQSTSTNSGKRKGRNTEDSEGQSEEAEFESAKANKPAHRSTLVRRSRAAEVHNLSERRRRDRINEKMRALQELIPHCNKTDKASMLDEAIEYLKSLQLQLQMMWMGSSMAPMMFPGVHPYMSRVGMGMGPASVPSMSGPVQLPGVPFPNPTMASTSTATQTPLHAPQVLSTVNFPNQMPNINIPEAYAQYLSLSRMQLPSQAMGIYPYGTQMMQQNQMSLAPGSSVTHATGVIPEENTRKDKSA